MSTDTHPQWQTGPRAGLNAGGCRSYYRRYLFWFSGLQEKPSNEQFWKSCRVDTYSGFSPWAVSHPGLRLPSCWSGLFAAQSRCWNVWTRILYCSPCHPKPLKKEYFVNYHHGRNSIQMFHHIDECSTRSLRWSKLTKLQYICLAFLEKGVREKERNKCLVLASQ